MILSIHQPSYLPWMGYFHKIINSDVFVILDIVQYEKNSFDNRNRVRTKDGWVWLTVPVMTKGRFEHNTWSDLKIEEKSHWNKKHLKSIEINYRKAPYFSRYFPALEDIYKENWTGLLGLNLKLLEFFVKELELSDMKIVRASHFNLEGRKGGLVLELCKHLQTDVYFSGKLGRDYLNEKEFSKQGIRIIYQDYKTVKYKQVFEGFVENLSVLDLLLNHGPDSRALIFESQDNPRRAGIIESK